MNEYTLRMHCPVCGEYIAIPMHYTSLGEANGDIGKCPCSRCGENLIVIYTSLSDYVEIRVRNNEGLFRTEHSI